MELEKKYMSRIKPFKITSQQQGFTLIELVIVIVILGVLAASAIPKFVDFKNDAKMESLRTVKAAMQGAVNLTYSKSAIKGNHKLTAGANVYVDINGQLISIKYGTPLANYIVARGSWDDLISLDYSVFSTVIVGGHLVVYFKDSAIPSTLNDKCMVHYKQANTIDEPPVIEVEAC